jgi:hypothetical protein
MLLKHQEWELPSRDFCSSDRIRCPFDLSGEGWTMDDEEKCVYSISAETLAMNRRENSGWPIIVFSAARDETN